MNAKDAIRTALTSTRDMLGMYLSDFSDADLLVRPVPNANHTAWQLGHLISAERDMVQANVPMAKYGPLPANFKDVHHKTNAGTEQGFLKKDEYLRLLAETRQSTIA